MPSYLAMRIEGGYLDYTTIFVIPIYCQFKDEVDAILSKNGRKDLIIQFILGYKCDRCLIYRKTSHYGFLPPEFVPPLPLGPGVFGAPPL